MNWYLYVGNNPILFVDPFGLCRERSRPLWKEATDILEFSAGTKFGLRAKANVLGLSFEAGGGIGDVPIKFEHSEFTSVKERDIGISVGWQKHQVGFKYSKTIPLENGRGTHEKATTSNVIGYSGNVAGADSSWVISGEINVVFIKVSAGVNISEAADFSKKVAHKAAEWWSKMELNARNLLGAPYS